MMSMTLVEIVVQLVLLLMLADVVILVAGSLVV